jgi:Icc-related predicted phosphoesterase
MRILALHDIHGNPDALAAVIADWRTHNADLVVVGGDAGDRASLRAGQSPGRRASVTAALSALPPA